MAIHGKKGFYQVLQRMLEGKPVLIPGDGTSLWTVTFAEDFAVAYAGLVGNPLALGEAFQITSGETLTWDQIHKTIASLLGVEAKLYHVSSDFLADVGEAYDLRGALLGDKAVTVLFDETKLLRAVPSYQPRWPFARAAERSIAWITSHPECQQTDPEFDRFCDLVIEAQERARQEVRSTLGL